MINKKQAEFEKEHAHRLDLTPGNLLDRTYHDQDTEVEWRRWCKVWEAVSGRFYHRVDRFAEAFTEQPSSRKPRRQTTTSP